MLKSELIELKKIYQEEIEKRNKINYLLQNKEVIEYLKLCKLLPPEIEIKDIYEIIKPYLNQINISKTNEIYVCTGAFINSFTPNLEPMHLSINYTYADFRTYKNIENGHTIKAFTDKKLIKKYKCESCIQFEQKNIILNPYNKYLYDNGYEEIRKMFFENSIKYSQEQSLKLLLQKYPRTYPSKKA